MVKLGKGTNTCPYYGSRKGVKAAEVFLKIQQSFIINLLNLVSCITVSNIASQSHS